MGVPQSTILNYVILRLRLGHFCNLQSPIFNLQS